MNTYKFKYDNIDLGDYLDNMRFRADELRRKAHILTLQAEIIDEERYKLEAELLPVDTEEPVQ